MILLNEDRLECILNPNLSKDEIFKKRYAILKNIINKKSPDVYGKAEYNPYLVYLFVFAVIVVLLIYLLYILFVEPIMEYIYLS